MRTKHLLLALAVPALFAACQNDDFTADGVKTDALQGRKSIGQVTFVADNDADTRMTLSDAGAVVWEDADALSVNLVDVPGLADGCLVNSNHEYAIDNYKVVDFVNSNFRFDRNEGNNGWSMDGNLVEGNYMIVAPFIPSRSREPLKATLPVRQQVNFVEGSTKTLDAFSPLKNVMAAKESPVMIGYRFLAADGDNAATKQVAMNLTHIYAYPHIKITHTDAYRQQPMTLKQVVIYSPEGFTLSAPLNPAKVRAALINEAFAPQGNNKVDQAVLGSWSGGGLAGKNIGYATEVAFYEDANDYLKDLPKDRNVATATINLVDAEGKNITKMPWKRGIGGSAAAAPKTDDLLDTQNATKTDYIVIDMPEGGVKLNYNESVEFNAIMPADNYNASGVAGRELKIYAIFAEGEDEFSWIKTINSNTSVTTLVAKTSPRQDWKELTSALTTPELKAESARTSYFNIRTSEGAHDNGTYVKSSNTTPYVNARVVTTSDELNAALEEIGTDSDWNIIVKGEHVVWDLTSNTNAGATRTQNVSISGKIYIEGGKDSYLQIPDYVSFENAVVESGCVTICGTHSKVHDIAVAENAVLSLNSGDAATKVTNYGTLSLYKSAVNVVNYHYLYVYTSTSDAKVTNRAISCNDDSHLFSREIDIKPMVIVYGTYTINNSTLDYPIYNYGTLQLASNIKTLKYLTTDCDDVLYYGAYISVAANAIIKSSDDNKVRTINTIYEDEDGNKEDWRTCIEIDEKATVGNISLTILVKGDEQVSAEDFITNTYVLEEGATLLVGSTTDMLGRAGGATKLVKAATENPKASVAGYIAGDNEKPYFYAASETMTLTDYMVNAAAISKDRTVIMLQAPMTIVIPENATYTTFRVRLGSDMDEYASWAGNTNSKTVTVDGKDYAMDTDDRVLFEKQDNGTWKAYALQKIDSETGTVKGEGTTSWTWEKDGSLVTDEDGNPLSSAAQANEINPLTAAE